MIAAAAELCAGLLVACDDLQILATSREPLGVAGEARYRLGSLSLPTLNDPAGAGGSEAVELFADRARHADMHFVLDGQSGPAVARLVRRLDGMPLAIELAAARVEALSLTGLLDRLDDRFALLTSADRLAAGRHRSLAAAVEWSYQLLDEPERRVFRLLSVFPGPFTLEAAEAVAGDAPGPPVLHLVDCSLLVPPRAGPDGRSRYAMLETLRAYGTGLLAGAGEDARAAQALAGYALLVAEQASDGLHAGAAEAAAAHWLDAEDAMMRQVLAWAIDHDRAVVSRLAAALGWWWRLRGRLTGQHSLLCEIAGSAEPGSDGWCAAQFWLGWAAVFAADLAAALGHFTAVRDAAAGRGPSRVLAEALAGRSSTLLNLGRIAEGAEDGRRSLAMARELGYPVGEAIALGVLAVAALYCGDHDRAVQLIRQQEQLAGMPGSIRRRGSTMMIGALIEAGDLAAAERACRAALARCQDLGDAENLPDLLFLMADLDVRAGRLQDAASHLREALQDIARAGDWWYLLNGLWYGGYLCTAERRYAEAITVWAAFAAFSRGDHGDTSEDERRHKEALREARQALGPARARAAEQRGAAMSLATAAEYVLMLTAPSLSPAQASPGAARLSPRERELVTLVAQGRTDAQIAAQLYISVRTVHTHLDRIRDKTGCRRRADLTRLALQAGLV